MRAVFLPGNDPANREVTYELEKSLPGFNSSVVVEWPHWHSEDPDGQVLNVETGSDLAIAAANGHGGNEDEGFVVIAKSMGVAAALRAQSGNNGSFRPEYAVFMGSPLNEGMRGYLPVDKWLQGFKTPSLWIQRESDPTMSAEQLRQYLDTMGLVDIDFVTLEGASHDYEAEAVSSIINQHLPNGQMPQ